MPLPELTICSVGYKRPWYQVLTLSALIHKVSYAGPKRYCVSDGGSSSEELEVYRKMLQGDGRIVITDNLSDMVNACAASADELWLVALDDYLAIRQVDLTPDVLMLLQHPEVGAVRMGRLAFWGHPPGESAVKAEMIEQGGLHWWKLDKGQTDDPYVCSINFTLYHRRFWDAYGDIPSCRPDYPGDAELFGAKRYNEKAGPTIAIPMRFGEDCGEQQEPFWHMGMWRTEEYAKAGGGKRL